MTPAEFVAKWKDVAFGEKQASQEMFLDICRLVEHPTPVDVGVPEAFTFEKQVPIGSADAYKEEHFGWEFKGSDSQLEGAFTQLLRYSIYLKTPPLLIVSSFQTIIIRTNFPGMETVLHKIPVSELGDPENLKILRAVFHAPSDLRPNRSVEDVTRETASLFRDIVADMEEQDEDQEKLARFLNQIVFCLYADDAGLLPGKMFTELVGQQFKEPGKFNVAVGNLFQQMATGGLFGPTTIPHFNGDLFNESDTVELSTVALQRLAEATQKNWQNIEPSIFGTLFERALDASKRSQLGAHYTSAEDIMLVVEPVVMAPLRREWEEARGEINALIDDDDHTAARGRLEAFQGRLAGVRVLDPACGSGNFLYLTLRSLLDLEKEAIDFGAAQGWYDLKPTVKPDQMLGLEINPYATELARTSLWIGYIQWHQVNGFSYHHSPILTSLDTIQQRDAILDLSDPDNPTEPEWPEAEFIVGNPPFLGHFPFRESLGDAYVGAVYDLYGGRIPNSSDLCCYWFEKARGQIEAGNGKRAGLLATQAIRFQSNRPVLERIKNSGDIFGAVSDHNWILDGAAVHTSIICFDDGTQIDRELDGEAVNAINSDLTGGVDVTRAARLSTNRNLAFQGIGKVGDFDIPQSIALEMLQQHNPNGLSNSEVIKRWINGTDITQRSRNIWVIDFGVDMPEKDAALFEAPFEYVKQKVKPAREKNKMKWRAENWWLHGFPATTMRRALVLSQVRNVGI
ncbi:MAG: class I SAM-dependent DNA methyltransferase [Chloroflexota bacterium]|nr:class I SAM-dependent DNA methyltransferase [Chloroflexota bacterium]